jgi:hypothetical protein
VRVLNKQSFARTALVIGAGGHKPYEFPTAMELREDIVGLYHDGKILTSMAEDFRDTPQEKIKKQICRYMQALRLVEPDPAPKSGNGQDIHFGKKLDEFVIAFAESHLYSIDSFLATIGSQVLPDDQRYFPKLGKFLIAYFIRRYETMKRIGFRGVDWIHYIINEFMRDKPSMEIFFKNPPKIYTFNYDTFLENCLIVHLIRCHQHTREAALEKVKKLNIMHIYGKIQSLEPQNEDEILKASMEDIKVIGEERTTAFKALSRRIADDFMSCNNVYFLGYGFDNLNNHVLFSECESVQKEMQLEMPVFHSTSVGLTDHRRAEINSQLDKMHGVVSVHFPVEHKAAEANCMSLIKVCAPIFSDETWKGRNPYRT